MVAAAVIGSAVIGGVASKSAANSAAKGQSKGLAASNAMSQQAIGQAKDYFNIGQRSAQAGFQSATDFFKQAQPAKYNPYIQGNVAAQKIIGQGATQANNAILGLPVDMGFANQQTQIQPDYGVLGNAKLQETGAQQIAREQASNAGPQQISTPSDAPASKAQAPSGANQLLTAGGLMASPTEMLNPINAITNPLGLGSKVTSKIDPIKNTKKLIKKIF